MKSTFIALAALGASAAQAAPPATVAVAFDRHQIRPMLAEGEADRATHRLVTADDPVRIASISKLVTAMGVMRLLDQGKLSLDRDVSDYLGWPLRNPAFPDRVITLRLLMSHQSSLIDGDDLYLIPLGTSLQQRLADPRVWDAAHAPGSGWFHYTNLNFPVVASVIERVTGERFDVAMSRLVLKPLKLDACFNWGAGCSAGAYRRAVVLYRASGEVARDDLHGSPPACMVLTQPGQGCELGSYRPGDNGALFSPQGGLRISMRDLARIGQLLAREGRGFISTRAYAELTHARWRFDGRNGVGEDGAASGFFCAYGLAVQRIGSLGEHCRDDLFGDGFARIGHAGDAYGLKAGLWWDPVTGKGLAYFTTAVAADAPTGRSAFTRAEESLVERVKTAR
ncbi:serine hydrolase domain-containing protein [Novosphingobium sp.]|uniref:serine hydrolase domain-containing protein n=1 Tax=Novosphingobium sp. TaxID=1874826 RepID=UPI0025E21A4A|nr:serine hydrolase domain-containing protein [Novosphingobium sp.]MCC6926336.1 beta-lactamase family protein [Novosphingobium sp.]